jgi:DNA-binding NtrC family response regulator
MNSAKDTSPQAPRILVVDDETSIRHVLRSFLGQNGCDVTATATAEEALELLPEAHFHVALVDLVLPGMSGIHLLGEIKRHSPDTEVVLMTAHGSPSTATEAVSLGAFDLLEKPLSPLQSVRSVLQRALEKRKLSLQVRGPALEKA